MDASCHARPDEPDTLGAMYNGRLRGQRNQWSHTLSAMSFPSKLLRHLLWLREPSRHEPKTKRGHPHPCRTRQPWRRACPSTSAHLACSHTSSGATAADMRCPTRTVANRREWTLRWQRQSVDPRAGAFWRGQITKHFKHNKKRNGVLGLGFRLALQEGAARDPTHRAEGAAPSQATLPAATNLDCGIRRSHVGLLCCALHCACTAVSRRRDKVTFRKCSSAGRSCLGAS